MKRLGVLVLLMVVAVACGAAEVGRRGEMPRQRPERIAEIARLLRPEAGFPDSRVGNRTVWDRLAALPSGSNVVARARADAAKPVVRPDDSSYEGPWQLQMIDNWYRLDTLVLAECLEGKGAFLPRIEELLVTFAELRTWTGRYHDRQGRVFRGEIHPVELGNGQIACTIALALDVLREKIDPALRARTLAALRKRCLNTYFEIARDIKLAKNNGVSWCKDPSNWNAACCNYMTTVSLLVLDDPTERATAVECAERLTKRYLAGFTKEGMCLEGLGYWTYGFGEYLSMVLWVRRATGSTLGFLPPITEKILRFGYESSYFDRYGPCFGDCNNSNRTMVWHFGGLLWPAADTVAGAVLADVGRGLVNVILRFPELADYDALLTKPAHPYVYPMRSWYRDEIAQYIGRPDPANVPSRALYASIQGSRHDRPHGHHDVGSYSVAVDGVDVMGDLGNSPYRNDSFGPKRFDSPMRNSYGHPVPRVDGCLQSGGEKACGAVVEESFSDGTDRIVYDLTSAYPTATNLVRLTRTFEYLRAANRVTVEDRLTFKAPSAFETALTTFGTIREKGKGLYEFASEDGKKRLLGRITVSGGVPWHLQTEQLPEKAGHQREEKCKNAYRAAIVLDEKVTEAFVKVEWR